MTIDIRAEVNCSLGPVISGSIGDDYIQGNGLIKVTGSVIINDLITPVAGTIVTFSYIKEGVTRNIPRKLRVISSFADPFRRTTTVELGCKFTYLSELKPAPTVNGDAEIETSKRRECLNGYVNYSNTEFGIPFSAADLASECLTKLGITGTTPLQSKFYRDTFDLTSGYVNVLSDLLLSESYCGYLNESEQLVIINLTQETGSGPVLTSSNIIDIGSIGVGNLPGDAVVVRYESTELEKDLENEDEQVLSQRNWTKDLVVGKKEIVKVRYTSPVTGTAGYAEYSYIPYTETISTYGEDNSWDNTTCVLYDSNGEGADLSDTVIKRVTTKNVLKAQAANDYCAQLLSVGINPGGAFEGTIVTTEEYEYDSEGQLKRQTTTVTEPFFSWAGRLGLDYVFGNVAVVLGDAPRVTVSVTEVEATTLYANLPTYINLKPGETYKRLVNGQKTVTTKYVNWGLVQQGEQGTAGVRSVAAFASAEDLLEYLYIIKENLVIADTEIQTNTDRTVAGIDRRPARELRLGGEGGGKKEFTTQTELTYAIGFPTGQRIIEFSIPYPPDDYRSPSGAIIKGEAKEVANRYGRVQNRLLLGNRYGVSLQLAPERLPVDPYSPLYLQASGLTALYRANATNWAFDSNGIICSVDALFWAAVGGTGTFWFPVAPGVVTLPETPPIVDGEMNANIVVLPYSETAIYDSRIRTVTDVTKFDYSLTMPMAIATSGVKARTVLQKISGLIAAAGTFDLVGQDSSPVFVQTVPAETGSFVLGGQDANLLAPVLPGAVGTFTLSGQPATGGKSISIKVGTAAPTLGSSGAGSFAGWNLIQNASVDDGFVEAGGWPFTFTIDNAGYTSTFVNSNTYITFGAGSEEYTDLSEFNPPLPKMHISSGDGSYQRVATQVGAALDGRGVARVRYEGRNSLSGTPGSPNIVYELAFYGPRENGDQWIELRVGLHSRTAGVEGPFYLANATTAYMPQVNIVANSSWVFVGNSTGTSWTRTQNRFIS